MSLPSMLAQLRLFQIQSKYPDVHRRGRLLQVFILVLSVATVGQAFTALIPPAQIHWSMALSLSAVVSAWGLISLLILRRGRPRLAAHSYFTVFTGIHLFAFLLHKQMGVFPYLALTAIIAIAFIHSIKVSAIYAALIIVTVGLFSGGNGADLAAFLVASLALSAIIWFTISHLQENTRQLQRRAQQFQRSVNISRVTSARLNLDDLLRDVTELLQKQFNLYYVSLYLLDEDKKTLTLREATGAAGKSFKAVGYQLAVDERSIIGWTAVNQQTRVAPDVTLDPFFKSETLLAETRSELALPLAARGQSLGVLDVQSDQLHAFQDEDVTVLKIIANQIAINIDNARLFAQTERSLTETKALLDLNTTLAHTIHADEMFHRAAQALAQQFEAAECIISSWNPDANQLTRRIVYTRSQQDGAETFDKRQIVSEPPMHSDLEHALQSRQPFMQHIDEPLPTEPAERRLISPTQGERLIVPLLRGADAIGVAELFRSGSQSSFASGEIQLAQAMANQTAVSLENIALASEAKGRVAELSALYRLSDILSLAPTLDAIFDGARREIMGLVEATGMSISLLTPEGDKLHWIYGFENEQEVDLSSFPPLSINDGFSGYVVRTREALHVGDQMDELYKKLRSVTVGADFGAWLGLPMIVANELIGVLAVENNTPFSQRAIELLTAVASSMSIAIHNLIQFEAVQTALTAQSEQRIQLQTAAEVAAVTTSILDGDALMQQAVNLIQERFTLYYVGLFLVDQATGHAMLRAGTGHAGRAQIQAGHKLAVGGHSLIGGAIADGKLRVSQDVTANDEWQANPFLPQTRSEAALPLRIRGLVSGALTIQSAEPDAFGPELMSALQTISDQLAIALENARLLAHAEARAQRQQKLTQISSRMYRSTDVNEIVRIGLQSLSELMNGAPVELALGQPMNDDEPARLEEK
ncbi:MAG: GAF domain-containing protein [Chloroflexi bacterium]|nr:GAF domain-containing protein [Chloroflexota bacterium]